MAMYFDVHSVRGEFPMLAETIDGKPFVYLDNAATTQKPRSVIDRPSQFYAHENSHLFSPKLLASARQSVARFLGAASPDEIIFVRSATDAIALVGASWGYEQIGRGDEIIVSNLEHHANLMPWYELAHEKGASLRVVPVEQEGELRLDAFRKMLSARTKLVALAHVSNVVGTIAPLKEIIVAAHAVGARVLVDGAQAVAHLAIDVAALDADFYTFSAHKVFGPTGIGALYVKAELMGSLSNARSVARVADDFSFDAVRYAKAPGVFEPGVPNIAGAVGLTSAIDYMTRIGFAGIAKHERELLDHARDRLQQIPKIRLIGTARGKAAIQSFVIDGQSPDDVQRRLADKGIEIGSGHFSAQPILRQFGLESALRASFAFYNTIDDIDALVSALV